MAAAETDFLMHMPRVYTRSTPKRARPFNNVYIVLNYIFSELWSISL